MTRPSFSTTINGPVKYTAFDGSNPQSYSNAWLVGSESVSGTSRRKPKGKWVDPTSYTLTARSVRHAYGSCIHYVNSSPGTGQIWSGVVGGGNGRFIQDSHFDVCVTEASASDPGGLPNRALVQARQALKDQRINLGVAFAERKQTAKLVGDTASRIARSVKHLYRGRVRRAMDELGISSSKSQPRGSNVPRKWLELQYGWKPLLSDVYGAVDALSKRPAGDWRITAKGSDELTYEWEKIIPVYSGSGPSLNPDAAIITCRSWRGAFVRIDATPSNEAIASLSRTGVTNPLEVVWERVPFSFVVDWFLPVGSYLNSLDAALGYTNGTTCTSTLCRAEWRDTGLSGKHPTNGRWVENNYVGTKRLVKLVRTVNTGFVLPSLPSFKDGRSLGHMANGLALLASAFGRR